MYSTQTYQYERSQYIDSEESEGEGEVFITKR